MRLRQLHVHVQVGRLAPLASCVCVCVCVCVLLPTAPVLKAGHPGVLFFVVGLFFGC